MKYPIQTYVILPCKYECVWYVLICMNVVCPQVYEYKLPIMLRAIIRFSAIVRVSKHAQLPTLNINTIWIYLMNNQERVKTTQSL